MICTHKISTFLVIIAIAVLSIVSFSACSEDKEGVGITDIVTPPTEIQTPLPDWADNIVTITAGRFQTKEAMKSALIAMGHTWYGQTVARIGHPNFILKKEEYTIDVSVISMLDAGIDTPAATEDIVKRYEEMGYRPLTPEESIELRLQLTDQPDTSTGSPWSAFFVLQGEEMSALSGEPVWTHALYHIKPEQRNIPSFKRIRTVRYADGVHHDMFIMHKDGTLLFDPYAVDALSLQEKAWYGITVEWSRAGPNRGTHFACAKIK